MRLLSLATRTGIIIGSIVITLLFAEAVLRVVQLSTHKIPFWSNLYETESTSLSPIILDRKLGWRATPGYNYQGISENSDGTHYPVSVTTNPHGFREFGNLQTNRPRILVIGDSFTQATDISDGKTYFSQLGEILDVEVFAYGAGGYGTLQEYMILDEYFDQINPDLVIWEFCPNDLHNNSLPLETTSKTSNNGMVRPYWIDGDIRYFLPKRYPGLRMFALKYSRLTYFVLSRWDMILADQYNGETDITGSGGQQNDELLRSAKSVTTELAIKVRQRTRSIPVLAFSTAKKQRGDNTFRDISREAGLLYAPGVGTHVEEWEQRGVSVRVRDGHWNEAGHRIVAELLSKQIREQHLLKPAE